jgi:phosphatidate phosphatase LPIN
VSVNDGEACVASTHEAEVQAVSQSGNNGLNYEPLNVEDEAHDVSGNNSEGYQPLPNKDDAYQPLTNEDGSCDIPLVQNDEACKSPSEVGRICDGSNENIEDAVQCVSRSGDNGLNYEPLNVEDASPDISENKEKRFQSLPNKDEALEANNYDTYQPLADEDEACDVPLVQNNEDCKSPSKADKVCDESNVNVEDEVDGVTWSGNNGVNHQPLIVEDGAFDISGNTDEGDQLLPNKDETLDVSENNDEGYQPVSNEDGACDIPLVQNDDTCNSPAKAIKVSDDSNENIKASFNRYDTFRSCLDLTSQDDGDSGTEPFSPEFEHRRDSELSLSNHSDIGIDLGEDGSETAQCDQSDPSKHLEEVDVSEITSDDNVTQSEDLSCEGGLDDKSKDTTPSKTGTGKSDRLRLSPRISDMDKLVSIPENPTAEEELNKEEHPRLQKGLGKHLSD